MIASGHESRQSGENEDPILNATLVNNEGREANKQLAFHLGDDLPSSCFGPRERLRPWRSLCRRFEPRVKTRLSRECC